ncbi:uncharacterized protein LOC135392939 [Ornithodoros turicata]|uniref:uncharacterized protein LOC135392939 n=1 Tax=Ornithodoros turicata TaxID=34597 RepID=UPI00313928A1
MSTGEGEHSPLCAEQSNPSNDVSDSTTDSSEAATPLTGPKLMMHMPSEGRPNVELHNAGGAGSESDSGSSVCSNSEERRSYHLSDIQTGLRSWAIRNSIALSSVTSLLKVLRMHPYYEDLPKDARTLMRTPRNPGQQISRMAPGEYCHFSLNSGLKDALRQRTVLPSHVELSFNIDGLPLAKSSKTEMWPIQCLVKGGNSPPFLVGAYCGRSKPLSQNEFLKRFVEELQDLLREGITINGKVVHMKMQYAIVEFVETKEVEVVPCSWIRGNKCLWPNRPSNKVVRMVKKGSPPGMDCAEYNAQVKGIFVSYRDARLKLPISELTSDMNSDVPAKRRRVPKVIESEDDFPPVPGSFILAAKEATTRQGEHLSATTHPWKDTAGPSSRRSPRSDISSDADDCRTGTPAHTPVPLAVPSPPGIMESDDISVARSETMHSSATSTDDRPLPRRSRSETVQPSVRSIDERSMPLRAQSETMHPLATSMEERPLPRRSRSETVQPVVPTIEERPMPLHEFQRQVLRMLNIIRLNQQQQDDVLHSLVPSKIAAVVADDALVVPKPLDSIEQLQEFENGLTSETEKKLVVELAQLGRSTCKMAVKRMLCHLLTNNLGMLYSWLGNKGKERFRDLKTVNIILRAVRQIRKLEKTTEYEVETEVKSWLRHAKERHGRLQKD